MDRDRVGGSWKQLKGKTKEQWGKLTDDDLDQVAGKREQLEDKIQERYGLEKDRSD
ncbi:CsbD family protein [Ensifer adhaerens]|uniref:CsbD family protein n=1 Tax=Ensifer adhaerens TaxID=106592 RepID=UPI000CF1C17E|nr:CsbD family protein [Ensifer adhaerens]